MKSILSKKMQENPEISFEAEEERVRKIPDKVRGKLEDKNDNWYIEIWRKIANDPLCQQMFRDFVAVNGKEVLPASFEFLPEMNENEEEKEKWRETSDKISVLFDELKNKKND